jgi:hypothetical protein
MQLRIVLVLSSCLVAATAGADQRALEAEREAARIRRQFDALPNELPKVAPRPGRETAAPRAPQWCSVVKPATGRPTPSGLARSLQAMVKSDWRGIFGAAELTCVWPQEPAIHQAVAAIEQTWINMTALPAAQAVETFEARLDADKFKTDKAQLCDQLVVSDEVGGAEKSFMGARRVLFGCAKKGYADHNALWYGAGAKLPEDLVAFLDQSAQPVDELARLAWIVDRARPALGQLDDQKLLGYVIDQYDYKALSAQKVKALADTAPYKGNSYARAVIVESLGYAQAGVAAFEAAVEQKASDADWKELLIGAPQRGIADFEAKAKQHEQALARSNDFEAKFWGPSRKALEGCWAGLRKDYIGVLQTLERKDINQVKQAMSDPVASLLLSRLAACAAAGGDKSYAYKLLDVARKTRYARGPRLAAYYAGVDALSKILADRTKFPVTPRDFWFKTSNALVDQASKLVSNPSYFTDSEKGTVKAIKKTGDKVHVTWVTVKHQEMGYECTDTNRIFDFTADGRPSYYRNCRATGMVTVDDTPNGIVVPAAFADGLAVGAAVEFDGEPGNSHTRAGIPTAVFSDKSKKKLVSAYGFPL